MSDAVPTPGRSYRALLGIPWVARILVSLAAGRIAASMASVALVLFALERFGSPEVAGLMVFASTFPAIVMGPIAGALLDRHGRVRLVVLDQLIGAAAVLVVAVLALADQLPAWLLVAISSVAAFTRPLSITGLRTLLPVLVPQPLWPRVNALDSNAFVLATLVGPAAAGALVAVAGAPWALIVVAVLLVAAGLALVGIPEQAAATRSGRPLLADAWEGVRYTWRNRTLRGLALSMGAFYAGFGVLTILVPVLLLERFAQGPEVVGLAWSVMAVAGGVAAFLFGAREVTGRERTWLARAMALTAAGIAGLLLPDPVAVVLVAMVAVGFLQGPIDIAMFTLRQRRTDPDWFGRAFAVSVALNGAGSPIAAAVTGALIVVSVEGAVLLGVALFGLGAVLSWWLVPATEV